MRLRRDVAGREPPVDRPPALAVDTTAGDDDPVAARARDPTELLGDPDAD